MTGYVSITGTDRLMAQARALQKATHKTVAEFVRWRAGIVTKDLIDFTPPRGPHPSGESYSAQRKRGYKNVERDIKKVFHSGADLWDILKLHPLVQKRPKLAAYLIAAIERKDYAVLSKILHSLKSQVVLIPAPLQEQHFAERNPSTGRVFKRPRHTYYVLADAKISGYVVMIQKDVGKMKHGWANAALKLGVKNIPKWILNQTTAAGACVDNSTHVGQSHVIIINDAKGVGRLTDIIPQVVEINQHKMAKELEAKLNHLHRQHGFAV